jgi:hypothetical protein
MTATLPRHEYRIARSKTQHGLLLGVVLLAIGLAVMAIGEPTIPDAGIVGAINLVLAAVVLAVVWRGARDPRPRMVLDEDGVWYRDWGIGAVPWSEIAHAAIGGSRMQSYLGITLADAARFQAGLSDEERRKFGSNSLVRLPELRVPYGALDAPLDEVLSAIEARLGDASGSRKG